MNYLSYDHENGNHCGRHCTDDVKGKLRAECRECYNAVGGIGKYLKKMKHDGGNKCDEIMPHQVLKQ